MRILFINHMGFMGGGEKSMLTLMQGLQDDGRHQVFLLAQPGELINRARELGFCAFEYSFSGIRRTLNPITWFRGLIKLGTGTVNIRGIISGNNIDVVHANSLKAAIMGGLAARRPGIPLVFHTRDFLPAGIWRGALIAWAYKLSSRIIANSKSVAQVYGKDHGRKVSVVYNYVEPPKMPIGRHSSIIRTENDCPANAPLIGYSGRLHPAKGLETLLTGFAQIQKILPVAKLWIVGGAMPGEERYPEDLRKKAEVMKLSDSVKFFGWRHDAIELMSCFDVLTVPSQREPFGRVTVEAMMLGIPVVATASGGTLEIIDDDVTGLLFTPGDHQSLAEKTLRLLKDPTLKKEVTVRAKKEVLKRFGKQQYITGVQRVYDSLVGK
jgi:glycosyltransferase involved in cell wall biosynthesis